MIRCKCSQCANEARQRPSVKCMICRQGNTCEPFQKMNMSSSTRQRNLYQLLFVQRSQLGTFWRWRAVLTSAFNSGNTMYSNFTHKSVSTSQIPSTISHSKSLRSTCPWSWILWWRDRKPTATCESKSKTTNLNLNQFTMNLNQKTVNSKVNQAITHVIRGITPLALFCAQISESLWSVTTMASFSIIFQRMRF